MTYLHPPREAERVAALDTYCILDTPPQPRFETFTRLASRTYGTAIAVLSLIDTARVWFKSARGMPFQDLPRDQVPCSHVILRPSEVLVVADAREDQRFAAMSIVAGPPHVRFYA